MTDFIHEHTGNEQPVSPAPAPEKPELDEKTGQKRVYGYIFILFIVAFSLLLWSYMMNQRSNDMVLSELRGNASAIQTTMERNVELEQQVDELQAELNALAQEKAALEQTAAEKQEAFDKLNGDVKDLLIDRTVSYALLLMADGDHQSAADLLATQYSTADINARLDAADAGNAPLSLRERYDAMVEQLAQEGYLTVAQDGQLKNWHVDTSDER